MTGIISDNVGRTSGLIKAASGGGGGGVWTLIKTLTSDGSDANLSFVNGASDVVLDSTYPIYRFSFINMHPETDNVQFMFNFSIDTGSNYNVSKIHCLLDAYHNEAGTDSLLGYSTAHDIIGTGAAKFTYNCGNDNDQATSGEFWLFSPSNTTYVKHYYGTTSNAINVDYNRQANIAGFGNTTSAIDAIQFTMSADEIQGGKIKMYGLKDSA